MTESPDRFLLNRRNFVAMALLVPVAAMTVAAARLPDSVVFHTGLKGTSTGVATARPAVIRSFGPNGTHWPAHTPWITDKAPTVVDVTCDWASIARALTAVTAAQAAAGVHIKVRPGILPGLGASSGSKPVLEAVGQADWAKNVLVSPRDGWGTVRISGDARLRDVEGVTFARINGVDLLLTNCSRSVWAHSKMSKGLRMSSSYRSTTRHCGAYEIVMSDSKADIADPLGYAAGSGCVLTDCVWDGCYGAPVFRSQGATDHVDTLQMYGTGWYRGLTVRDSTFFGSLNCALQIGGARDDDPNRGKPFLSIDHSIVTSQATAIRVRYPLPPNAEAPKMAQAINGIGEPGQLYSNDSYIFGSMYRSSWGRVQNTKVSYDRAISNNPVASGSWTYDSSLNSWGAAQFNDITPSPTDQYLAAIWR
ncbi:hypothetical protein ACPW96_21980 [Micromonospora sp. DT81.3]|uniref:hypothetical protein n=1 Tax=Micromonospora sp. DT81.3 TaxID=3416523 RepID=UPI003CF953F2